MTEYLIFEAGGQSLGVAVSQVREVVRAATLSRPAGWSNAVEGLLNFRGSVVPVVDLRHVMNVPVPPLTVSDYPITVGDHQERLCAVRSCSEVRLEPNAEPVVETTSNETSNSNRKVQQLRVGHRIVLLLNPDLLTELAVTGVGPSTLSSPNDLRGLA